MAKMQSAKPARKVWVAALAGAATTVLVFLLELIPDLKGKIPAGVSAALVTILSFLLSYFIPPSKDDQVVT